MKGAKHFGVVLLVSEKLNPFLDAPININNRPIKV